MDQLGAWAVEIAEAAAPDEVALAPQTVQAYIAGGADRADLFYQNQRGTAGGADFGIFQVILPYLLQGLHAASPLISEIFSSTVSGVLVEIIKQRLEARKKSSQETQSQEQIPEPLKRLRAILSQPLRKSGLSEDKIDLIIDNFLRVVLENPDGTRLFLQCLVMDKPDSKPGKHSFIKRLFKRKQTGR
jgi:hypothetical protein